MANRSYLYSLSNRPTSYADRPETISGLSEWAYDVPFIYRLLMSSDPQLCASLISDGLNDEKVPLYAISSSFGPGFERVKRFVAMVRIIVDQLSTQQPASVECKQLLQWLDETLEFLEAHKDQYLLLETIELDVMVESEPDALREMVEEELERCLEVGAAFEALPADNAQAARVLQGAASELADAPLDAFFRLRFDDECDSTHSGETEHPIGLFWSDVLYFDLFNREQFEAYKEG